MGGVCWLLLGGFGMDGFGFLLWDSLAAWTWLIRVSDLVSIEA